MQNITAEAGGTTARRRAMGGQGQAVERQWKAKERQWKAKDKAVECSGKAKDRQVERPRNSRESEVVGNDGSEL